MYIASLKFQCINCIENQHKKEKSYYEIKICADSETEKSHKFN